jgi:hypothetical protein
LRVWMVSLLTVFGDQRPVAGFRVARGRLNRC